VEVDWHADPNTLVKASDNEHAPPFRVIWLKMVRDRTGLAESLTA